MKKFCTENKIMNKIILVLVIIILFNFAIPCKVQANFFYDAGQTVIDLVKGFLGFLGDTVLTTIGWTFTGQWNFVSEYGEASIESLDETKWRDSEDVNLPNIIVSPETIMEGRLAVLSINFIEEIGATKGSDGKYTLNNNSMIDSQNSDAIEGVVKLRNIIAKWYVSLRNLALVGLLSVLVYTGIKIILSSTAQDKAKYKERLLDWIVAICLLFFLHYIMLFTIKITESIVDMLAITDNTIPLMNGDQLTRNNRVSNDEFPNKVPGPVKFSFSNDYDDLFDWIGNSQLYGKMWIYKYGDVEFCSDDEGYEMNKNALGVALDYIFGGAGEDFENIQVYEDGDVAHYKCTSDDGTVYEIKYVIDLNDDGNDNDRYDIQLYTVDGEDKLAEAVGAPTNDDAYEINNFLEYVRLYTELDDQAKVWAFLIIYIVLIIYTIMFAFRYIKRVIYMAFLTLMAPLVALTYPIDKMKDGQAQAFNMWLKEYVFNALIQPFHLLIYTILVGSAIEFATSNLLYALVAIGFILPAENLLRKFFGFESASTLSKAGSFAGGALFASMFNALKKPPKLPGGGKNGGKEGKADGSSGDDDKINYYNGSAESALDTLGPGGLPAGNQDEEENTGLGINEYRDDLTDEERERVNSLEESRDYLNKLGDENKGDNDFYNAAKDDDIALDQYRQNSKYDSQGNIINDENSDGNETRAIEENTPRTNTPDTYTPSPIRYKSKGKLSRAWAGTKAVGKRAFRKGGIGRKVIKGVAKVGMGAVGGVAGATVGIAAGVASGDLSKTFQYGTLGAGAGYIAGGNVVNAVEGITVGGYNLVKNMPDKVRETRDAIRDDYHQQVDNPEEYKEYKKAKKAEQRDREIEKFKKNDTELRREFGEREAERIMEESLPTYFDNNITTAKEMIAIEKFKKEMMEDKKMEEKEARRESIRQYRINKELKSRGITKEKDKKEEIQSRLESSGVDGVNARMRAREIVENGHKINNYMNKNKDE